MTTMPDTLPVPEAARRLGVSRTTAYRAVRDGLLPTLRIRGRVVVLREPLERLLRGATSPPSPPERPDE